MKEWNTPNQVPEWVRQTEWGSVSASLLTSVRPCVCVCQVRVCERMDEWVNKCSRTEKEREREEERERGSVPSERTHSTGCDWSMGQLTRGALSSSCTLLFIPLLPHTAILPCTTHTHTDTLTYMHTVGATLCWHFILSFTIVQLWTQGNYRGYIQQFSQAHCGLKCGRMKQEKIVFIFRGEGFFF